MKHKSLRNENFQSLSLLLPDSTEQLNLTDAQLVLLSEEINLPRKLRKLGIVGLKIDNNIIDSALQNNTDIVEAAYDVLKQWRDSQPDKTSAYTQICQALTDVKMEMLINETLK